MSPIIAVSLMVLGALFLIGVLSSILKSLWRALFIAAVIAVTLILTGVIRL